MEMLIILRLVKVIMKMINENDGNDDDKDKFDKHNDNQIMK